MLWSDEPMIVIDARTVVLGYLFRKGPPSVRVRERAGEDGSELAAANGRALITGYWGGYVFVHVRSEEHTSELQSLMRISCAVFCLKKKREHRHVCKYTH